MEGFFTKEAESFLHELVAACGISGNTKDVEHLVRRRLSLPHIKLEEDRDGLGHLIGVINPGQSFRVMIEAHMDAVGLRVTLIDSNGFIYVRSVGGTDPASLKGQRVKIWTRQGPVGGLLQYIPLHHAEEETRRKFADIDDYWIRTQYTGQNPAQIPVEIGNPVTFDQDIKPLGENILSGPGFDDRVGVLIVTELMRRLNEKNLKATLYGVATCGEEIGCRGVRALTRKISPSLAIAIDVTAATDYPGAPTKKFGAQSMGKGPVIAVGYNTRSNFNEKLMEVARKNNIPFQLRAEDLTPTDGREMDEAGVPTLVVRLPGSMLHTANDLIDRRDIESTSTLLYQFLQALPF